MKKSTVGVIGALVVAGVAAVAWSARPAAVPHGGKGGKGAAGPVLVSVVRPRRQDLPVVAESNGTVTPLRSVELHPQTTAAVARVHIREGQFVRAGQVLFTLDDRADRAALEKARAQVARDAAALADAERQHRRAADLLAQKFIARSQVDSLQSQVDGARALLAADRAAARASEVAAGYTVIRAPLAGRVGAITVYPGSLVQPATTLVTVTELDPITVAFTLPEAVLGDLLAAQRAGAVPVEASADGGAPVRGQLSFIDNAVDPAAGTIKVKAQLANAGAHLWPGQFVHARVTVRVLRNAVVVPQDAIVTNVRGTFVYTVLPDQSAAQVPVRQVHAAGLDAAVEGLRGDETVITAGKQNLKPGARVRVATAGASAAGAPAAGAPAV
jgi:RND family efflux transporter MFP subunit